MTDSPRRDGSEPTRPPGDGYGGYTDPAYAGQSSPYGPTYPAPPNPTERLPAYSPYGYDPNATGQYPPQYGTEYPQGGPPADPPADDSRAPRWLWVLAAVAVVAVVGLVIALVIVNSSKQNTVVAPLPSLSEPSSSTSRPPTTTRTTPTPVVPLPPLTPSTTPPSGSAVPGVTEPVTYEVSGTGRAISIMYADSGGMLQTEFNVVLPWSKQVQLAQPAAETASITIINIGSEVTCSVSVNGQQIQKTTGNTFTICVGSG